MLGQMEPRTENVFLKRDSTLKWTLLTAWNGRATVSYPGNMYSTDVSWDGLKLPILLSQVVGNSPTSYSTKAHTKVKMSRTVVASGYLWKQRPNIDPVETWPLLFPWSSFSGSQMRCGGVFLLGSSCLLEAALGCSLSRMTLFERDGRGAREAARPPAVTWCLSVMTVLPPGQALTLKSCACSWPSREKSQNGLHLDLLYFLLKSS